MPRWFLSYHSPDQGLAEQLKAAIERKDPQSRVFFAPTHLRAGGSWSAQLAQELAGATAFILLIGQAGIGKWQVPEYDEALDRWVKSDRKFPLIVVLLEGQTAPGLAFLRQLHWIVTPDPTSEKDIARIFDAVSGSGTNPGELWRYTSPYRGLESMEEKDSDYFFGRQRETVEVLSALAGAPDRLPILIGNSGVGKSSLAQAGVLAALKRQAWPEDTQASNVWPAAFQDSRQWCFLSLKPGTDPLKALVESFLDTWQFAATDVERIGKQNDLIDLLLGGRATLPDLIDATERRRKELDQPKPPGFFVYVDQAEELYVRSELRQRQRFSQLLVQALPDPRLRVVMSMRSDFLGHLQNDEPLFSARQHIDVPPLREAALREIVGRPAHLLSARFESDGLIEVIGRIAAEDSVKDAGALPLLSYTLDDMWSSMVQRGDGTLRLPVQSFEHGGVLADRANRFLETHPGAEATVRRVLTLRLATVREDGEPTRRRAARAEFTDEEWRLISELADHPNRLLVTVTTEAGDTFAEVAHEAIFRRWDKLRDWITANREFLVWRTELEAACRAWQAAPEASKPDSLLMGAALTKAKGWIAERAEDVPEADRAFVLQSEQRRRRFAPLVLPVVHLALGIADYVITPIIWLLFSFLELVYVGGWSKVVGLLKESGGDEPGTRLLSYAVLGYAALSSLPILLSYLSSFVSDAITCFLGLWWYTALGRKRALWTGTTIFLVSIAAASAGWFVLSAHGVADIDIMKRLNITVAPIGFLAPIAAFYPNFRRLSMWLPLLLTYVAAYASNFELHLSLLPLSACIWIAFGLQLRRANNLPASSAKAKPTSMSKHTGKTLVA
jgi:TIR domain